MKPLAERLRPQSLETYIGQKHLVGKEGVLRKVLQNGRIPSIIFWGPPGVGKTTLSKIIARQLERAFYELSAINSGVKDIREAINNAKKQAFFSRPNPILFIDEIHRFSKSQQDALLGAVEQGVITLIGATTENPSFEVISALLSRCQVYTLKHLEEDELEELLQVALTKDEILKNKIIEVVERNALFQYSGGDARKLLNILELTINAQDNEPILITDKSIVENLQQKLIQYDKSGEMHYDVISAFIKSVRGSDPNAAIYWLARMLEGGEDVKFIARRLIILAAEDIGLANPNALLLANSCFDSVHKIGMPEARIILSQTTIYLATSPKSNAAYTAIDKALAHIKKSGNLSVPLHLRNAPTKLMKELNYGQNYKYAHDFEGNFVEQDFLPTEIKGKIFYHPQNNTAENRILERLRSLWKKYYRY